ncbi:rhomboid-like protein [Streptodolium elevatio]
MRFVQPGLRAVRVGWSCCRTDIGHFSAVLLGLACYPLAGGRGTWDPAAWARGVRAQIATARAARATPRPKRPDRYSLTATT